ncbi:hypothetical protein DWX10_16360 [Clostridium sp. AF18-27]|nr:hypothetical protein DWX10_16360 [Clostridium sp. AF18-27]
MYYYTYIKGGKHHGKDNYTGGGVNLEEVTAIPGDIIKGKTAYTQGSDDPTTGTLQLTGNAQAAHVLAGETFYATDCKTKLTGTMAVNSLLSFSVAAYSGRRVLAKWQNPKAASGKPYSGVYIRYSTSGNPGKTGGTQIYKGAGNNTASEGQSQAYLDLPALSTKYYLSIYPYVTCSAGEMTGAVITATVTTAAVINKTFTAGGSYTIPAGYSKVDVFCVGGGGGAEKTYNHDASYGGCGGYTQTIKAIAVSSGQVFNVVIGAGGINNASGGSTSITRNGIAVCSANGGTHGRSSNSDSSRGGSGGGMFGPYTDNADYLEGYPGGSDGNDGYPMNTKYTAKGQGTTTRAWGISSNTLYAGGGGGGSQLRGYAGGVGGAGGAGTGGSGISGSGYQRNGTANTGGGAGGAGYYSTAEGTGGSGIVLLRLY